MYFCNHYELDYFRQRKSPDIAAHSCYKSVYTNKLERISGKDIHFWYGTKEAFAAKPQAKHLLSLCPEVHVQVFDGMNHGQLLVDHPEEVAGRMIGLIFLPIKLSKIFPI